MEKPTPTAFLLVLISLLGSAPGAAQECGMCHEIMLPDSAAHSVLGCEGCHSDFDEETHPEGMDATESLCAGCHDIGSEIEESVHGGMASCSTCHGDVHGIRPAHDVQSPVSPVKQIATCGTCHEDSLTDNYVNSEHGHALIHAGLVEVAPSCADCHGAHDILPSSNPASRTSFQRTPETCASCHVAILGPWKESVHGRAWQHDVEQAPVCSDCHAAHGIERPDQGSARLEMTEKCGDCHHEPFESYLHSFHGKAAHLGLEPAATCADCHGSHDILPWHDPESHVYLAQLRDTCRRCHENATEGFLGYDPHNDPTDPEDNVWVYRIYVFMTALLIGVFGFFGLHDLLWLQRILTDMVRGRVSIAHRPLKGKWVRRFSRANIGTHLVIVITFLTLAATGLPLRFHYTEWAQFLASFGSIEAARVLHRIAAVITFGYALFHVGLLSYRVAARGEADLMWGWKSMIPQPRDLRDFAQNLRYFLYMGDRPRLDRWTYWEKFDYFAVFWGIPIIGGSGLMLWFPEFFTRFLPGWTINAATVVHSDEALLATSFIFIFHFFHTHLRPESFPMDPVIFLGSMPLEEFREQRPVEYERLVRTGELESRIVPPPTPTRVRIAYGFGFAAVSAGIVIAFAIIVSLLAY